MEYQEKQKIINRICSGGYFFRIDENVYYFDLILSARELAYIEFVKEETRESAINNGVPTNDEMLKFYIKNGKWSNKKEKQIEEYKEKIEYLKDRYYEMQFNEKEKATIEKTVKSIEEKIHEIYIERHNLLFDKTVEYMIDKMENRCKFVKMLKTQDGKPISENTILNPIFYKKIEIAYFSNIIKNPQMREIARSNPWRISWSINKSSTNDLFGVKSGELTTEQMELCYYSRFYDSVYEAYEKPSDEIIENDFALDIWWKKKLEEYDNKNKQKTIAPKGNGHKEVFVMTDKDGADKVYKMNDKAVRGAMRQRDKIIRENGSISEGDLVRKAGKINSTLFVEGRKGK